MITACKGSRAVASAVLAAMLGTACAAGGPISMKIQAGSTIVIPLPENDWALSPGFGSEVTKAYQDFDDQRGELVFYLRGPLDLPAASQVNYPLKTRYVTRIFPDRSVWTFDSELLALADIPRPTDSPAGPNVTSEKQFKVLVYRRQRDLPAAVYGTETPYFATYSAGTPDLRVTIIPGIGSPNPYEGWWGSMTLGSITMMDGLYAHVPDPQLVIAVGSGGAPGNEKPGAASIDVSYPYLKASIVGVSEWQSKGSNSIVRWAEIGGGQVRIWLVDPEESVAMIAVAFKLGDPVNLGRVASGEFSITQSTFYRKSGLSYASTPYPVIVGIR